MTVPVELVYAGAAVLCAGVATIHDLKDRKIPNKLTGPAILAGLVLHLVLGGYAQLGWALLAGLIAGGVFLLFHLAGGMGAGDVKLMAAVGCIAGISSIREVLLSTVIIGGVFALALAAYRGRVRETLANVFTLLGHHRQNGLKAHPELNVANRSGLRLPYAVPIALGCLWSFCMQSWGGAAL
jgi:prepilin peptidase CpaA